MSKINNIIEKLTNRYIKEYNNLPDNAQIDVTSFINQTIIDIYFITGLNLDYIIPTVTNILYNQTPDFKFIIDRFLSTYNTIKNICSNLNIYNQYEQEKLYITNHKKLLIGAFLPLNNELELNHEIRRINDYAASFEMTISVLDLCLYSSTNLTQIYNKIQTYSFSTLTHPELNEYINIKDYE